MSAPRLRAPLPHYRISFSFTFYKSLFSTLSKALPHPASLPSGSSLFPFSSQSYDKKFQEYNIAPFF